MTTSKSLILIIEIGVKSESKAGLEEAQQLTSRALPWLLAYTSHTSKLLVWASIETKQSVLSHLGTVIEVIKPVGNGIIIIYADCKSIIAI